MKVLHVMTHFPWPPNNGARADIWARLLAMKELGYSVHVLVIGQKTPPSDREMAEVKKVVDRIDLIDRRSAWECLASFKPTNIARNSPLADFPLTQPYDVTIMEAEDTFPICSNPTLKTSWRVIRIHNDEVNYLWEFARHEEKFMRRQFVRMEALRMIPYSKKAHRGVDSLWFISQDERQKFIAKYPADADKAVWLPPSILLGEAPKLAVAQGKRVLFVGNFYTSLNRDGLRWYLKHVHPVLMKDPDYDFIVVGSTLDRPASHQFVEEIKKEPRCTVHADWPDPDPLYGECAVFVNPMRSGAGVKLKSIHAIEKGIPVVSTSIGNEGNGFLDREHLRVADTPEDFASAVTELLSSHKLREEIASRAYNHLTTQYNSAKNIDRLVTGSVSQAPRCDRGQHAELSALK
jgi:glycosyltransferase involved in cell wall biosynthesis